MSRSKPDAGAAYGAAMRHQQEATLHLYRAVRADPTPDGVDLLKVTTQILREVTQAAKRRPPAPPRLPSVIMQVDADGTLLRLRY